ncbi:MAG: hypothetical protein PVF27_07665 [Gemmatimonadales bacterium]|jgi:TM2 domain-containing membrane protein YozV
MTDERTLPAFLSCFFFGVFGAHRLCVGKMGPGSCSSPRSVRLASGPMIDFIMSIVGAFKDADGNTITEWT